MSDLINKVREAQVRAGEKAVIDFLDEIGLGDQAPSQTCTTASPLGKSFIMSDEEIKSLLTLQPTEWLLLSPTGILYKTTDVEKLVDVLRGKLK